MKDQDTTIAEIQQKLLRFNADRHWGQYHSPRNLAMALSVEAGELLALYLWSRDSGPQPPVSTRAPKVEDEAADVLICLLNFCAHSGIDLAAAVEKKMLKNAQKYPVDTVYGRMEKYDEL